MTDVPPQLGEISHPSDITVPTLQSTMADNVSTNGNPSIQNAKDTVYSSEVGPCVLIHPLSGFLKQSVLIDQFQFLAWESSRDCLKH